jgi:hypothetical protein
MKANNQSYIKKYMPFKKHTRKGLLHVLLLVVALFYASIANAIPISNYATNSKLSDGKWKKIKVTETGLQYLSNAKLKNMGFSNPDKVNIYGYGGRLIQEELNESTYADDLPMQPIIRTSDGIYFYGVNTIRWSSSDKAVPYTHCQNFYATESYYFVSDIDTEAQEMATLDYANENGSKKVYSFNEHLLHEQELAAPSNTGAWMFGEDFRTNTSQTFNFDLPDNTGSEANVCVSFATKTSSASSSFQVIANGTTLPSTSSDVINEIASTEMFIRTATSYKTVSNPGEKLELEIKYNPGGVVYIARLDYIRVSYERELKLRNGCLNFYYDHKRNGNPTMYLKGCSSTTQIWDVTNPAEPKNIKYILNGDEAVFTPTSTKYAEYIAFETTGTVFEPTASGSYLSSQDIHALETPDMVIISPQEFTTQAERVAEMHRERDGMTVHVVTPEQVYNEFSSGVPDISSFRKMLKMWYDRGAENSGTHSLKYCLLFGRPTYDFRLITDAVKTAGYPRVLTWISQDGTSSTTSYCTDDYIGYLEDTSTGSTFDMVTGTLNIAIGRMPVRTVSEAKQVVDKLLNYIENPTYGNWRNQVMIIADDQDNAVHLEQAEEVYANMRNSGNGSNFLYERLYLDAYPLVFSGTGNTYPAAKEKMMQMYRDGVGFVNYIGHANPKEWTHERFLTYTDILEMDNKKLPIFYTATCEFCRWDADDVSGAELMWSNTEGGAIAMLSTNRTVYITQNGWLNNAVSQTIYNRDSDGQPLTIGEILRIGKNIVKRDDNRLRYVVLGDPAMRILSPTLGIAVDKIGDSTPQDMPTLEARSQTVISGRIVDDNDNTMTDFNGTISAILYDAEQVIETLGNGDNGKQKEYNDRKNRLFSCQAKVKNGVWSTTVIVPSEITNNYSPGLLSFYAYSDKGLEANGATEQFYVYGWDENAKEDLTGPDINSIYLNNSLFKDGDAVSPNPVLIATVRDESGINISTVGIGHQLTITLDGNTTYSDVSSYYTPDSDDIYGGKVVYPLSDLETGSHTLKFTVWDNMGNSSSHTLNFEVSAAPKPYVSDVKTNVNPATTSVTFYIYHDRIAENAPCTIEVFNLAGRKVWEGSTSTTEDYEAGTTLTWDLNDVSGTRVQRGIYLYRATVTSKEGASVSMTKKLAVAAK